MSTKYITNPMLHIIVLFYSSMYVLFNYVCYECLEIRYGVAFHCFCSVFVPSVSVFDPPPQFCGNFHTFLILNSNLIECRINIQMCIF